MLGTKHFDRGRKIHCLASAFNSHIIPAKCNQRPLVAFLVLLLFFCFCCFSAAAFPFTSLVAVASDSFMSLIMLSDSLCRRTCSSRTEMSLELLPMSESSLEENCRFADDVTADENRKSERCGIEGWLIVSSIECSCGIDGGGVSLLESVDNGAAVRLLDWLVVAFDADDDGLVLDGRVVVLVVVVAVDEEVLDVESVEEDVGLAVD